MQDSKNESPNSTTYLETIHTPGETKQKRPTRIYYPPSNLHYLQTQSTGTVNTTAHSLTILHLSDTGSGTVALTHTTNTQMHNDWWGYQHLSYKLTPKPLTHGVSFSVVHCDLCEGVWWLLVYHLHPNEQGSMCNTCKLTPNLLADRSSWHGKATTTEKSTGVSCSVKSCKLTPNLMADESSRHGKCSSPG